MLSSWLKSILATVAVIIFIILIELRVCHPIDIDYNLENTTYSNISNITGDGIPIQSMFYGRKTVHYEIMVDIILFLILVWFLNREFEINYRLSFYGNVQAENQKQKMQAEKAQTDWLLHNIIPEHVSVVLKKTSKYSKNYKDVGIVFAKVVNFDEFYDESFEGGREYYRVLNELISDFEDAFDDPKYKDVEKIKTIGACLMVASGLNPSRYKNEDPDSHLYSLMEFCLELLKKLEQFNMEIFNFDFEMSIGFNFGEVTAGVIGTTKLLYDIWGDAVNISSRMYSTGVHGKIQVPEDVAKRLESKFEFEYRGTTYVKGKGDMNTYLVVKKKDGATWS